MRWTARQASAFEKKCEALSANTVRGFSFDFCAVGSYQVRSVLMGQWVLIRWKKGGADGSNLKRHVDSSNYVHLVHYMLLAMLRYRDCVVMCLQASAAM
eukprot:331147-Pyramimonas_sp.AAC.1